MSAVFPYLRGAFRRAARVERTRFVVLLATGLVALVALVAVVIVAIGAAARAGGSEGGEFAVRRGTLAPAVPLVGTLAPARSDSYGAVVPGVELKILSLVEEGSLVAPGDRLIQFDPAPFVKELEVARARARELESEQREARLALVALRLKSTADVAEATTSAQASERDLSALVNTAAPLSAKESAHDVEQKERTLGEAQEKLSGLEPFVEKGFISQDEYRTARSRRDQAAADLELARARHAALVRQANPDLIRKKLDETEMDKAQLGLLRERAQVSLAQGEAAVGLTAIRLEEANRQVAEAEKKIAWCTVAAKAPGLAVYSDVFDRTGERRKIRVGDSVWGGTTVVTLPDLTRMMIQGRVPESEIHHLGPGLAVDVTLDAFPQTRLTGQLRSIGSVGAWERNESRSFPVTIALDQADPRFRPGMVARCTVRGAPIADALYVPIEAVHSDDRGSFVWVKPFLGKPRTRRIETGTSTAQFVQVKRGLREGERVRMTP